MLPGLHLQESLVYAHQFEKWRGNVQLHHRDGAERVLAMKPMKVIAIVGAAMVSLAVAAFLFAAGWSWVKSVVAGDDTPTCSFEVESHSALTERVRIIVTTAVRNNNSAACGLQVSVAVKDKAGKQIAVEQLWVSGVSNIPAGATHSFPVYLSPEVSLDRRKIVAIERKCHSMLSPCCSTWTLKLELALQTAGCSRSNFAGERLRPPIADICVFHRDRLVYFGT